MGRSIKSFLGFWMLIFGILLIAGWFIASFISNEPDLLIGTGCVFLGLLMTVFGWSMWRGNIEVKKKSPGWVCEECGNEIHKNDKYYSKCGIEFD